MIMAVVVELCASVRDLVFSSQKRCESLKRASASFKITNNDRWVLHVKIWQYDKITRREDKDVLDGWCQSFQ